jgi:hypothetical protein
MPNDFTYQAVRNRNLIVYEGGFKRTFVHVRDMARSILFALERWSEVRDDVYNVGHESMNFTKEDVARQILKHVDYYLHFAEVGHDADQRNYEVSYEKIRKKGFETTIDRPRHRRTRAGCEVDRVPEPVRKRLASRSSPSFFQVARGCFTSPGRGGSGVARGVSPLNEPCDTDVSLRQPR